MSVSDYDVADCDPSGEGCGSCPRMGDDCDGNEMVMNDEGQLEELK